MNEYMTKALEIISEWNAKSGEERYSFCRNCVYKSIKNGRKLKAGNEIGDATNDTYIKVATQMQDAGKLARNIERRASQGFIDSLAAIITRAANAVLQRESNQEKRDSVIISDTAINGNGEEYSLFDTIAGAADTETAATIRATLKDFYNSLDSRNKIIFGGMMKGQTEREIAPTVGISNVATHNRMTKIRAQLAAIL